MKGALPLVPGGQEAENQHTEELFSSPPPPAAQADPLLRITIELRRTCDLADPCCDQVGRLGPGKGPHEYEIRCSNCERQRGWMPKQASAWLQQIPHLRSSVPPVLHDGEIHHNGKRGYLMRRSDVFKPKYIKGSDIPEGAKIVATISHVTKETFGRGQNAVEKAVLVFADNCTPLPLNLTLWDQISKIAGSDESNDWRGCRVEMFSVDVDVGGEIKRGVRVRKPTTKPKQQGSAPTKEDAPF
jgi:hypothetical protein